LIRELPNAGIISVGHRSSLIAFHETRLVLEGEGRWRVEAINDAAMAV
jgi:putative ATP-binding cassette transporter